MKYKSFPFVFKSPCLTKAKWFVEIKEMDSGKVPEAPILTVTVNNEDKINNF